MGNDEFVKLVADLRKAQKGFFRSNPGTPDRARWLEESKRLERQVDDAIKEISNKQRGLFDEPK